MKTMSAGQISVVCGGTHYEISPMPITGVTIDSRSVKPGDMFVALKGARSDGHDHVLEAFKKGAACAMVERLPEEAPDHGSIIQVESCEKGLMAAAALYRGSFFIPVVGITGSVGKTTAKEMVASVLSQRFATHKTEGNFNNNIGVPLTLFGLDEGCEAAVIEMGISHFGEMKELSQTVMPTIVLMTNIGSSHLEFLGDPEGVLKAKSEIFEFADAEGSVFLNGDDKLLRTVKTEIKDVVYYGLGADNDYRAENIKSVGSEFVECDITGPELSVHVRIPGFGEHLAYSAAAAAAIGKKLGLAPEEIAAGIAEFQTVGHRAGIKRSGKITVIDDCYNANPGSVKASLSSLAKLEGRRVAILGDMRELGEKSGELHSEVGAFAESLGLDLVLCVGSLARDIFNGAGQSARWYADKEALIADLPQLIREGDSVLVKASRGMALETVVDALLNL